MKSTGIVRKIDDLGRIVIPIELRRTLGIDVKDPLEIYVDSNMIIFRKYEPACTFCGNAGDTIDFKGKIVCTECLDEISNEGKGA
ncbi:AbrB family transcriptional regulator [Orenia metallireducens]|jgi:transcriptional pleiotropic regulator of transition state genes|uniref:Transcriptional regulator, AbrB family n=1 Tax=Orenia metallireducens TaxID=1413210 RepID=A0A285HFA8_9FIRM|nr:AbrB/MazE/SpoVT family DNA-binding domain-containing protein [Orenia metallireducens]PRX27426.1 AbrB family transcriptional regulator [Orenia metallireducens]SNY34368.1 transcriptional regulator, AbrB family [Orenia metallireducens]